MLFLLVICTVGAGANAQQDFSGVTIKVSHVAGNVHMLEGRGGNIGVSVGPDGILIIDDQFAPLADKIRAALGKLSDGKLKFVLNTHYHPDHVGGNAEFGPEAPIIAHVNVYKRLATQQKLFGRVIEPQPKEALPVITFEQSLFVHFNDERIEVIHFPHGHTDGDSVVFFPQSNVVHMGDDFFNGMFPFVDLDHGGSVQGLADNVEKILARLPAGVKVIPGHGPLGTLDDLKSYHRMLVEMIAHVQGQVKEGKTLQQIQAAGIPPAWQSWAHGFINSDKWLETIYKSLS